MALAGEPPVSRYRPVVRLIRPQADLPLLVRQLVLQRPLVDPVGSDSTAGRNLRRGSVQRSERHGRRRVINGAYTTIDDTLFIGEIQLGLEWNYGLCCLPANAFFRMALEYQRWDGGQGVSEADSFAGISILARATPLRSSAPRPRPTNRKWTSWASPSAPV